MILTGPFCVADTLDNWIFNVSAGVNSHKFDDITLIPNVKLNGEILSISNSSDGGMFLSLGIQRKMIRNLRFALAIDRYALNYEIMYKELVKNTVDKVKVSSELNPISFSCGLSYSKEISGLKLEVGALIGITSMMASTERIVHRGIERIDNSQPKRFKSSSVPFRATYAINKQLSIGAFYSLGIVWKGDEPLISSNYHHLTIHSKSTIHSTGITLNYRL